MPSVHRALHPRPIPAILTTLSLLAVLLLPGCASAPPAAQPDATAAPQPVASTPRAVAAATAHPLATAAALEMLAAGGSVVDAAAAAQLVLGLVEPQSSGLGGGGLIMLWSQAEARLRAYDGLAAAPGRATVSLDTDVDGRQLPAQDVTRGGRSVGVPGTPALLELAHRRHGRLPWARLFEPAIRLAEDGYPLAPYLRTVLSGRNAARDHPDLRDDLFDAAGSVHPVGTRLRNPAYARTLRTLASLGVEGWWRSGAAARLVAATRRSGVPGLVDEADLLRYRAVEREPLCAPLQAVQRLRACFFGPPSFGGIVALQTLQMAVPAQGPVALEDASFWHRYAESGRLAQADRRHWVGDPGFADVPAAALVAAPYLEQRAAHIDARRAARQVPHGDPRPGTQARASEPEGRETADATSQLVVADARGDVLSMTTTINLNFGSRIRVDGYVLNNAMTNFGPAPERGQRIANQMAAHKRPITSMSPLVVFDEAGRPLAAGGSAGGGQIVDYIARNLIEMLWLGRSPAQALAGGHVSTALAPRVQLEAGTPRAALAPALRELGHEVTVDRLPSGAAFLLRRGDGWLGAADPRRDGTALGR